MASKYDKYLQGVNPQPNELKEDTIPDNKQFLLDVELPDQTPSKNKYDKYLKGGDIMDTKVFPRDPETEFGIGQAFLLGLGDSVRGISQFVGREKGFFMEETLEEQQRRLNKAMQAPGGGLVAAAYFGGAILDPVTWLIPVLKGKKLWQMAKFGAVAGGLGGALGYVDEQGLFNTRSQQALGGALGGAIITPAIGKGLQLLKVKKLKKSFGLSEDESPDISKLNEKDFIQVKLPGSEDVTVVREGQKRAVKKIKGRGDVILNVRKKIKFKNIETKNDIPTKVNPNQQNDKSFILRGPREFFKTLLGPYKAAQNIYEKNLGKPAFDYFTQGKFGPELGSGLVGGAYGFSLPEEDGNTITRLNRAVLGFMAGAAGMKGLRAAKIPGTAVGKQDEISLATYLGRAFIDEFKLPKEIAKLKAIDLGGLRGKIELEAIRIAQKAQQLTPDEKKVLYNMLEGDIKFDVGVKELDNLSKKARENINDVTQMYVDAGLITEETALRNIKRYLRRTYSGDPPAKLGSDLKARGVIEEISPKEWVEKYSKTKAFTIDDAGKTVPLENHNGWELFGRVSGKLPKDIDDNRATPELIEKLAKDKKFADEKIVNTRWEYTKQERLGMGEIEDGAFAILETGRLMSKTLPQYKFYADIAQLPFVKTNPSNEEIERLGLVQIPKTTREGTLQPIYGKLAGKFVPPEVKQNIVNIYKASNPKQGFFENYRKINQIWKSSKTAWNPTVHVNNIVSNFVLTDLVDGNILLLPKAATAFSDAAKGKRSKVLELAQTHGVFDVDYVTKELDFLDPKKISSKIYKVDPEKNAFENATGIAKNMYTDLILKEKVGLQKLSDWYRSEDAIFRLALFMDRLNKGFSPADAALDARKSFIDYNISAPGINALRNLPTPFLAYTYRVIPILAETAVVRPWKFAKYAVLGYMLNNLGALLGEGDEEAERAAASQNRQGRVFGLPILPHRSIKLPTQDKSRYIDITRYVPGGDVLDLGQGTIPGLPAPLQPSFGLAGDLLFPLIGYDIFKGDKLRGQGVSMFDDMLIRGKAVVEKNIPNFPFVPGAYSTRKIEEARVGDSPLKATDSELLAFANSIGIKIREVDLTKERRIKTFEFSKRVRGIREQLTTQANKYRNGSISIEEYRKKEKELTDKYNKIEARYVKALNLPIKDRVLPKIGIPFTSSFAEGEALETIGSAIKEQTERLLPTFTPKTKKNKYEKYLQ